MKAIAIHALRFRANGKRVEVAPGQKVDLDKDVYEEFLALGAIAPSKDEEARAMIDATTSKPAPKAKAAAKPKAAEKADDKAEDKPDDAGTDGAGGDDGEDDEEI